MSLEMFRDALAWSAAINLGILVWWFLFITLASGWVYEVHSNSTRSSESNLISSIMPG